jgi:hypothetical protein
VLVVPLRCEHCGAAGRHLDGSLLALCAYCGAVIARHRDAIAGAVDAVCRAYRGMVAPDEHDARLAELDAESRAAVAAGDRERFRAATSEALLIRLADRPGDVPAWVATAGHAAWVRHQVALHEIARFDHAVGAHLPQVPVAALEQDPARVAVEHFAACARYAAAVFAHPDYPVELRGVTGPDALAADVFRVGLAGAAPMLSADASVAALAAGLGAAPIAARLCATCGGRCEPAEVRAGRCPWCRSAIDVDADHPWVAGLARVASAACAVGTAERRASAAVQIAISNVALTGKPAPVALVLAYLRRAVPDLSRDALTAAVDALARAFDDRVRAFLAELRAALATWAPTAPPPAPVRAAGSTTIDAAWDDPWVRTQLVTWRQITVSPADAALAAVSMALMPLALGGTITAAQAAAFLLRTSVAPADAIAACELRRRADPPPAEAVLLDDTIALLRAR